MLFNRKLVFILFIFLTIFTRFYKLNWGNDFFFNPDENNMANSVLQMDKSNLDPNFYSYGQFPLYLTFLTSPKHDTKTITLTLRFWSALFSSISIVIFYYIGTFIFSSKKKSQLFILFLIFTPGLIQISHFGTTESLLLLVFASNILLSFKIFKDFKIKYLLFASFISGIGFATKMSALILTSPVILSLLFLSIKKKKISQYFLFLLIFIFVTIIFGFVFSPYNLINPSDFLSSMKYEVQVATGQDQVFYTRQFIDSIPYLFQLKKIFPYTNGVFIFIFAFIGFYFFVKSWVLDKKNNPYLLITLFSSLFFFIYQGQLFVKWTRFMSPIFFVFPLFSIFFFQKISNKLLRCFLIILAIIPGVYFLKTYFYSDTRIQATLWIDQNILSDKKILSEAGNVVNLPVYNYRLYVEDFDFYTLDENLENQQRLYNHIKTSDYIFVPSRRVFKNQSRQEFPVSKKYFDNLFSNKLGFSLIKTFSNNNSFLLNHENAEETWSVFDNPVIRIFQRQ